MRPLRLGRRRRPMLCQLRFKATSLSKLLRLITLVVSFQVSAHALAISLGKGRSFYSSSLKGMRDMKKSAFHAWSRARLKFSLRIRSFNSLGSSFSSSSLFFSPCRSGIAFISSSQSFMLCFGFTLPAPL